MTKLIILGALLLTGCPGLPRYKVTLPSGEEVNCKMWLERCGATLYDCTNGRRYSCMLNIQSESINERY